MEKDLVQGKIGAVGNYDIAFKDGEVMLEASVAAGPASLSVVGKLDGKSVVIAGLEWLKAKIPGQLDDAIISIIEDKIKSL